MKNINIEEMKRYLKRTLKKKVRITVSLVFIFLMTNSISLADIVIQNGKVGEWHDMNEIPKGSVALNPKGDGDGKAQVQKMGQYSVAIGQGAETKDNSVAIGKDSHSNIPYSVVIGFKSEGQIIERNGLTEEEKKYLDDDSTKEGQATAVGSKAIAVSQATALGNDVYARGRSSIAIGSDDVKTYTNKITEYDAEHYFKKLYRAIDPDGEKYGFKEVDGKLKIKEDKKGNIIWSPTLAEGHGAIAIGTRSIAYDNGATALGTLAYALGKESTALGTLARAEGRSSIALGNKTAVFANNSVSTGNESQVIADGGMTYGYRAYAGGKGSIAIGSEVYANTKMNFDKEESFANGYNVNRKFKLVDLLKKDLNGIANNIISPKPLKTGDYFGQNPNKNYLDEVEGLIEQEHGIVEANSQEKNGISKVVVTNGKNAIVIGSRSVASGNNAISLGRGSYSIDNNSMALGSYSYANSKNSLAIGTSSKALGKNGIAIGVGTGVGSNEDSTGEKKGYNSLALGTGSFVQGNNSSLIGSDARVWGKNSLSIGAKNDVAGINNVALGTGVFILSSSPKDTHSDDAPDHVRRKINEIATYKNDTSTNLRNNVGVGNNLIISPGVRNSLILGTNSVIGDYKNANNNITDSLVIGNGAKVRRADNYTENMTDKTNEDYGHSGNRSMAIGALSEATLDNSVALGHSSRTDYSVSDLEKEGWSPKGVLSIPSSSKVGILSVGSKGAERRISNVAAGYRETDAVNVSQLRAIEEKLSQSGILDDDISFENNIHYLAVNKKSNDLKKIEALKQKEKNYQEYIQYKSRQLEIQVRKKRGDSINSDYETRLNNKVNELEKDKNNSAIQKSKLKKIIIQENSGNFNYDEEINKIYEAKNEDKENKDKVLKNTEKNEIIASNFNNEGAQGIDSIALGVYAKSTGTQAISIGRNATAGDWAVSLGGNTKSGNTSVSIGDRADSRGTKNIAIGNNARIGQYSYETMGIGAEELNRNNEGTNSIAVGTQAKSIGNSNIAIGQNASAGEENKKITQEGKNLQTVPNASNNKHIVKVEEFGINNAISIGKDSKAKKDNSIAIGSSAIVEHNDSVAIGNGSKAVKDESDSYLTNISNTNGRTFSIGSESIKRRLKNLADGREDSDAVTVAQLKRVNSIKFKGDNKIEQTFELSKKIDIIGSTDTKDDGTPQTWDGDSNSDTMHTVENVKTFVSKSGDTQKILIGIKNKPRFGSVKLGNNGEVVLGVNNDNLQLNNKKITGISNGESDNDAVAYGQVKNPFIVKADMAPHSTSTEKSIGLGTKLEFTGRKFDGTAKFDSWTVNNADARKNGNYTSENVETFVTQDNGTGRTGVLIGLRKDPRFDKVTLGELENDRTEITKDGISITKKATPDKVAKFGIDDKGNATLTDARNTTASPIVTEKSLGDQKIKYAANNGTKQETTLTNGFNFSNGTNTTAEVAKDGVVKFNLKNDLTGITSIEKGTNGTKITLNDDNITVNKKITGLVAGTENTDAINKKQFDDELGKKLDVTTYNNDKQNFVTKNEITNKLEDVEIKSTDGSIEVNKDNSSTATKKIIDLKVKTDGNISETDEKAVSGKTVYTYLGDYAKKNLDNITDAGKKVIKDLVNVSKNKIANDENILEIDGGKETDNEAKDYKLTVKKSKIQEIAKDEAKKFVSDSVSVSSKDGAITVDTDKNGNKVDYKLTLNQDKIKELSGTTNLATEYAKVDGSNLSSLTDDNKKAWATGIGTSKIEENKDSEQLVTDKAVKEYLTTEIGKVNNIIENKTIAYKANSDDKTKKVTTLTNGFDFTSTDLEIKAEDNGKVTFNLTDKVKNSLNGKGNDGRDGKDGVNGAGSKGLTGKDGLNGKDLTTKVNALRNGEAGTVVYTDKDGNRLVKANNGNYYKAEYVDDKGNLKVGHTYDQGLESYNIFATLVNPDGTTTTPTTKLRVADGSISKDSKEAINGGQLNNLGYMLGLEVNEKNTGFKAPKITDLKGTNTTPANILDGLNQTREHINKGLTFEANYNADPYGTSSVNRILGGTLSITASGAENGKYAGTNNSNYTGTNLATYVKTDAEGKKKFYIGMKETPTFKSINIGSTGFGDHQTDTGKGNITADDNGLTLTHDGASVTIAKDGDKAKLSGLKDFDVNSSDYGKENSGIAATQKEVKDVLNKINANGTEQSKLKNGTLGTLVYTDKDGNKLMKDTDGKFYKAKEDGTKEENAQEVVSEDVILSTVKPDGKTTEPITLGNVASALGLSNDNKKNGEILKKLVNKEAKKDVYKDAELNKVVTLRDLQFLASKGITFAGSTGTATKFLGDTITINGSNSTGLTKDNFATKYETKNIAVKVDNTSGNIEVGLAKELSKINSITSEEDTNDKTKTKITLSKDGATFGVEKDVINGNNTTTQQVGVKTTIGKDGISVTKQGETNPSVSIKESSIDFATTSADNKTVGTGSITGLKDLDNNSDGHMAANKNYVDKKFDDVANKVVNINKQVNQNINDIKQNSKDIKSLGEQIKTVEKLSKAPIKFGTNSGYVDKKLGDAIKIKGTGTVTKKYDEEYNSNNIATKTDEKGNIVIGISKELKDMKSFETEQDKTTGNSSKLDQNGLTITDKNGTKENPRHTVEITKDKIVFRKEYKDGTKDNVENGIVIDNKSNTITGIKTKDTDKGDTVVSKQYVDDKLNQKPFGYFVKNTVFGSDGKEYSKDTVEVDGKRFEGTDKVIKGEDNNYYKEKDIKGRKYDSKTHLWSGADIQPTPVDEAKPLNSTNLVRGKDGKFYNPIDLEDAIYDKDSNKYKKNGADVTGGKEANDVVIKALPNIKPMALSNIGDGRMIANSTDAVNGGQVFEALKGKLDKDGSNIEQKSFATNASKGADLSKPEDILVTDKQVSEHLKNNYYNKTQVNNMISTIDNKSTVALEKSELALGGVANAVAMANLVQVNSYSDYRHNLSAAYGYYGGSHALAVGFSGTNEERNFVYKLSGSVNNKGNLALGVGAGVMLGDVDEHNINKLNVKKVTKKLEFANEKIEKYEKRQQETDKKIKELSEYKENSEKRIQELEKKLERLIKNK